MKKLIPLLLVLLLIPCLAAAEVSVTSYELESSPFFGRATNTYYLYTNNGYRLYNAAGEPISDFYGDISARLDGYYFQVINQNGLNTLGVIDHTGKLVVPMQYGDIEFVSERWLLGYTLVQTDDEVGEYKDREGNKYNIKSTDVYFDGAFIGTLDRTAYNKTYRVGAVNQYLYVRFNTETGYWLNGAFERTDVTADYFSTSEFQDVYKKGILHNPTQQYAFTAGCTLTPDDVEQDVWYQYDTREKTGTLRDLQGNVVGYADYEYASWADGWFVVRKDDCYGVMDTQGNTVVEPLYDEISRNYDLFPNGYQAVLKDGALHYLDKAGNVTAKVSFKLESTDYKGYTYNAPMATVNNLGQYIVITATKGQLSETYDDASMARTNQRVMAVQKDGMWGVIDMDGNVVIPFTLSSAPEISLDGTVIFGTEKVNGWRVHKVYNLTYDDAPAAPAVAEAEPTQAPAPEAENTAKPEDGHWFCTECGTKNGGKFCMECGTPKPVVEESNKCKNCGYDPQDSSPKFCPECGTKF